MEALPARSFATDAAVPHPETPRERDAAATAGVIPSTRLLRGAASVTIDHEGMHYVLRATRAGKLILTK